MLAVNVQKIDWWEKVTYEHRKKRKPTSCCPVRYVDSVRRLRYINKEKLDEIDPYKIMSTFIASDDKRQAFFRLIV